jgi:predicted nucleic acid-binding Zn ribbon protein
MVSLADSVAAVSRELGVPDPDTFAVISNAWLDIVGATVAEHARVRSVRDGVCNVEVDGPAWATQLRYLEAQVVERATQLCGGPVITAVKVQVTRPARGS